MKRVALLAVVFSLALAAPWPIRAACRMLPPGQTCAPNQFPRTYTLTIAGTAQCTRGTNGTYTVCCDEQTEANSVDSVRAPLCGSSEERGKANATCWDCGGGTTTCDGLDFSLGYTDPFISQVRTPVHPDDANTDQVWRIPNASIPSTFTYNGIAYAKPSGDLIVCRSNTLACGSSDACTNLAHPDVNNRGSSGRTDEAGQAAHQKVDGIPVRNPPVAHTELDTTPGMTAVTLSRSEKRRASDLFARIAPLFGFPVVNGRTQTTETELTREMKTVLGTTEPLWDDNGALSGGKKGGKLMPLSLANQSLGWPQFKEGQFMTEKYAKRTCAWFGKARPPGDQGRVSPYMAETEPLVHAYPIAKAGFRIWEAFLGTASTRGVRGLPTLNFVTPRQEWGEEYDPANGRIRLKPSLYDLMFGCGADSSRRQTGEEPFAVLGFLGFGDANDTMGGFDVSATRNDVIGDIFQEDEPDRNGIIQRVEKILLNKQTTITVGLDGAPAFYSSALGWLGSTTVKDAPHAALQKLAQDYKGYVNTFLPLTLSQNLAVRDYDRLAHSATNLKNASLRLSPAGALTIQVPHAAQKGAKEGFSAGICMITPLAKQSDPAFFPHGECEKVFEAVSRQHGSLGVPPEISSAVAPTWPQEFREGILGREFLEAQYAGRLNLITAPLTDEQRARLMTKVQGLIDTYVTSGRWPNSQLANPDYQQQIHAAAQQYGINEAFLYALWIEETHASSAGDYPFGCGSSTDFSASLSCVMTDPTVQTYIRDPLPEALCMYAEGHRDCTFEDHPNFVRNLMYYYDTLTAP